MLLQFYANNVILIADFTSKGDVLSVTGGVPRYLEEIEPGATALENLNRLCFLPKSLLREDFDEMFSDVITRQPTFTATVMRSLVDGAHSVTEIAKSLGLEKGGRISEALSQLEEAGIVASDSGKNPENGKDVRMVRYRLKDNYSRFYLKYIEPEKAAIDKGVQADLLVQTRRSMCVVEVKRQREIGREVIDEVDEKVKRIPHREGMSVRTALIYEGHLAPIVEADGYFDAVIPFRTLLGI